MSHDDVHVSPRERSALAEHVVDVLGAVGWGLRRSYAAGAGATVGLFALALVRALTPAGIALTGGGLINAAVASSGSGDFSAVVPWLCGGLALALLDALTPFAHRLLSTSLQEEVTARATSDLLEHVGRLDFGELDSPQAGDAVERARQGALGPVALLVIYLSNTGNHAVQIVSAMAILAHLQPAALLLVAPFAIPYAALRWRTARRRHAAEVSRTAKRRWMAYFVSHLASPHRLVETRLLGLAPLFVERYRGHVREIRDGERRALLADVAGASVFATLTTVVFYVVFARVVWLVVQGGLTLGDIAVFLAVSSRLRLALESAIADASFVVEQALVVSHLRAFLRNSPRAGAGPLAAPAPRRGELELDDVAFTYPGADEAVLRGVSLRVAPGEVVALVGANGAGKTTLVKLIARLYDPDAGRIRLDGVDLRDWPVDALRASIGFLPQSSARYEATAGENIAFGDWGRLAGDPEGVRDVARAARVDDLVESLPDRFETLLGPMFGRHDLSGGEWQKLAMARTLARDTCLLMLDEPSSHLDAQAEEELFRGIRALARGRATILISHRLSMVGLADRILVLDAGHIVENGTHEELMASGGLYAALFARNRGRMGSHDEAELDPTGAHAG